MKGLYTRIRKGMTCSSTSKITIVVIQLIKIVSSIHISLLGQGIVLKGSKKVLKNLQKLQKITKGLLVC